MKNQLEMLEGVDEARARRERFFGILGLSIVAALTFSDLMDDRSEGADWSHLLVETTIMVIAALGAVYLWRRTNKRHRERSLRLASEVVAAREDAARWRREASTYLKGLGQAIEQQFSSWGLSPAEKEVGLLLLKGLSHKEIAEIRTTGERTVRQQAAAVYRKGSLEGRAELSAFFLEDLLLPAEQEQGQRDHKQA